MFAHISDYPECLPTIHLLQAGTVKMKLTIPSTLYNAWHVVGAHICLLYEGPQLGDTKANA